MDAGCVTACFVRMHACAPLRVSKDDDDDEERWERRAKCVCVCEERRRRGGCARLNSVTSVHYN